MCLQSPTPLFHELFLILRVYNGPIHRLAPLITRWATSALDGFLSRALWHDSQDRLLDFQDQWLLYTLLFAGLGFVQLPGDHKLLGG